MKRLAVALTFRCVGAGRKAFSEVNSCSGTRRRRLPAKRLPPSAKRSDGLAAL